MLREFMAEWNEALRNRQVVPAQDPTTQDPNVEDAVINFRGTEIKMHRVKTGDNRYTTDLFVPKTNKSISNKLYRSRAQCASAIMLALTMGTELDERRRARMDARYAAIQNDIKNRRMGMLQNAGVTREQGELILQWMKDHPVVNKKYSAHTDDIIVKVIAKYYGEIVGTSDTVKALDPKEQSHHIDRMYEKAADAQSKAFTTEHGEHTLSRKVSGYLFRNPVDPNIHLPQGILLVREIFTTLDGEVPHSTVFTRLVDVLVALYESITGITPLQVLANAEVRKAKARERRLANLQGGRGRFSIVDGMDRPAVKPYPKKKFNKDRDHKGSKKPEGMMTIGDAFGGVFDNLATEE